MPPLRPWSSIDVMRSRRYVALALLSAAVLATSSAPAWSSSESSSESSSSSSSSGSSADWDEFMAQQQRNATALSWSFVNMIGAAAPFYARTLIKTYQAKVETELQSICQDILSLQVKGSASCTDAARGGH